MGRRGCPSHARGTAPRVGASVFRRDRLKFHSMMRRKSNFHGSEDVSSSEATGISIPGETP